MKENKQSSITLRKIFVAILAVLLAAVIALLGIVILGDSRLQNDDTPSDSVPTVSTEEPASSIEEETPSEPEKPQEEFVTFGDVTLSADYSRLLVVNAQNPLPDEFDTKIREYLTEIEPQYRNNDEVKDIHKEIYPYLVAMVSAAQAEGVDLRVRSPYRTFEQQGWLFEGEVAAQGGNEEAAAKEVARPATSEHHTGIGADFNRVNIDFEDTPMFKWLQENAADYGFVMRYPKEKENVTGVKYEPWHWRFVGINAAKEMKEKGFVLEEYIEYKNLEPSVDMYTDDK